MIIDVHTHIWTSVEQLGRELAGKLRSQAADRIGKFNAGSATHERAMSCVDAALIFGFRSDRLGAGFPTN